VLACRLENELPAGVTWRRILTLNESRHAGGPTYHFSVACHHCRTPACLEACPSGAYEQRPDGTVYLLTERCLGCRYCEMACPFGAPSFDAERGVMSKCHYCAPRREGEGGPACVEACPTGALTGMEGVEGEADAGFRAWVPGFFDPADCDPTLRFRAPGGSIRAERHGRLLALMDVSDADEGDGS